MLNYNIQFIYTNGKQIQYKVCFKPIRNPRLLIKDKKEIVLETSKAHADIAIKHFVPIHIAKYDTLLNNIINHRHIADDFSKVKIFEKYYDVKSANLNRNKLFEFVSNTIYLNKSANKETAIKQAYKSLIGSYLEKRVKYWKLKMGLGSHKTNISLKPMTWAFGLCKCDRKNISFALRAFSYSKEIVDYLIVHELAHIKYFHHQKEFWQYVQNFIPNCLILDKQLKY